MPPPADLIEHHVVAQHQPLRLALVDALGLELRELAAPDEELGQLLTRLGLFVGGESVEKRLHLVGVHQAGLGERFGELVEKNRHDCDLQFGGLARLILTIRLGGNKSRRTGKRPERSREEGRTRQAVVARHHDQRVVELADRLQGFHRRADQRIEPLHLEVVVGHIAAYVRMVGKAAGQADRVELHSGGDPGTGLVRPMRIAASQPEAEGPALAAMLEEILEAPISFPGQITAFRLGTAPSLCPSRRLRTPPSPEAPDT